MEGRLVVIDCHALGHQVKHSLGELTHDDLHTGVIYGFIFRILYFSRLFDTNRFAFAWDSRLDKRKEIYPDYKKKKKELTDDEIYESSCVVLQFNQLREEILPALGFKNIFHQEGYEADDLIASIVNNYQLKIKNITCVEKLPIVVSSDNDLYQLLFYCDMYLIKSKSIFTAIDFVKKYDMIAPEWQDVKALAGCSGDGVPGIEGCGQVKAIKYLKGELTKGKIFERITANPETIELTRRLTTLPLEGTKEIHMDDNEEFDINDIVNALQKYDMHTLISGKNYKTWEKNFCDQT